MLLKILLEMETYRYQGHSMSDPAKYRTKEELAAYKDQDPIAKVKHYILEHDIADQDELDEIDAKIKEIVQDSVDFAEESPFPSPEELYEDIYVQEDYPYIME